MTKKESAVTWTAELPTLLSTTGIITIGSSEIERKTERSDENTAYRVAGFFLQIFVETRCWNKPAEMNGGRTDRHRSPAGSLLDGLCAPPAPVRPCFPPSVSSSFSVVFLWFLEPKSINQHRYGIRKKAVIKQTR